MRCKAQDLLEELAADALRHLGHRKCRCCHQHRPQSLDRRWGLGLQFYWTEMELRDWEKFKKCILLAMCAREHVAVELQQTFSIDMVMRHRETWRGLSPCQLCKTKIIGAIWTQQSMMYVKPRLLNPEWWIPEAKPNQWEIAGSIGLNPTKRNPLASQLREASHHWNYTRIFKNLHPKKGICLGFVSMVLRLV